jgi:hypothetical protein
MRRDGSKCHVFGESTKGVENRFGSWLTAFIGIVSVAAVLLELGLEKLQIGTHSFRKGVATFLSSMVGGPSPIAIYLRAGWSLGPVQSRYILEGQGGDQLCGRAATGLTMTSTEFARLPPHFNASGGSILTVEEWEDIVPGFTNYFPSHFRPVIPFLLASLIFHKEWLVETLPAQHPLFNSRVWTCDMSYVTFSEIINGCGKRKPPMIYFIV